jgi:hypothetical protein
LYKPIYISVDFHKHLGIVFSSDGKWTRHIDYILSKASKQVCVLRKNNLKREILEKIYLTFIRPFFLEYSCEEEVINHTDKMERVHGTCYTLNIASCVPFYWTIFPIPFLDIENPYSIIQVMLPSTLLETEMTTLFQDVAYRYTNLRSSRLS